MKIFFTSDLHLHGTCYEEEMELLKSKVGQANPDVLAISGDISDMHGWNTYAFFAGFDIPVVFCLGNHDFVDRTVDDTHEQMRHWREEAISNGVRNAHCLDIEGHFDTGGIRFYGNVLWYDGSLYNGGDPNPFMNNIWSYWLDSRILRFNPTLENKKCVAQMKHEQSLARGRKCVMLTHCVPHRGLNLFDADTPLSIANCYSGMHDLFGFHHIHPDLALCGHTHRRTNMEYHYSGYGIIKDIPCINSGNDYFGRSGDIICDTIEI